MTQTIQISGDSLTHDILRDIESAFRAALKSRPEWADDYAQRMTEAIEGLRHEVAGLGTRLAHIEAALRVYGPIETPSGTVPVTATRSAL